MKWTALITYTNETGQSILIYSTMILLFLLEVLLVLPAHIHSHWFLVMVMALPKYSSVSLICSYHYDAHKRD